VSSSRRCGLAAKDPPQQRPKHERIWLLVSPSLRPGSMHRVFSTAESRPGLTRDICGGEERGFSLPARLSEAVQLQLVVT
jgi:hypothetical protein